MIAPTPTCSSSTRATAAKYFHSAFWLGVSSGKPRRVGANPSFLPRSMNSRKAATTTPIMKNRTVIEIHVHMKVPAVGWLPTMGS